MRFLSTYAAAAAVTAPLVSAQLNQLAKAAGKLYFGTATDTGELSNTTYVDILSDTNEFGQLTPSNGQKWFAVEPEYKVFNFTEGEIVTDLAEKNGQILRCHNTVWHSQLAPWVEQYTWSKENFTTMLKHHVYNEISNWKGQCYAWDVVNEGLNENGTYRDSIFYQILGEDYFKIAFQTAAEADPGAKLYYNDYNIESPGPKATAAQNIVKMIKAAGIRIDGVGLQSHFVVGSTPTIDQQISTMQGYTALGVEVAITELDIRLDLPVNASNLAQQKLDYYHSVGACVQVKECVGVTVWDFYDPFSWIPGVFPTQGYALLWFANFTKHPAYQGVVDALTNGTNGTSKCKTKRAARSLPLFETV